jgi:hypothetical protein
MYTSRRIRIGLVYVLMLQALAWLIVPVAVSAAEPSQPRDVQVVESEGVWSIESLEIVDRPVPVESVEDGVGGPAVVAASTTLTVSILSTTRGGYDDNEPDRGPAVLVVEAVMTNTGGTTATLPTLSLDYNEDALNGWVVVSGEYMTRTTGSLAPGEAFYGYWFARYPTDTVSSHQYTVTASAENADAVSTSDNVYGNPQPGQTVETEDAKNTGGTGQVSASAEVVVGAAFTVTLTYNLGQTPEELAFSPVGNVDFDAGSYRLLGSQVRIWEDAPGRVRSRTRIDCISWIRPSTRTTQRWCTRLWQSSQAARCCARTRWCGTAST